MGNLIFEFPESDKVHLDVDGQKHSLRIWKSQTNSSVAVIALHGMISHAGWFAPLSRHLTERNINVIAPDRLGSGESRDRFDPNHSAEDYIFDLHEVIRFAASQFDRIILLAWCWGARLASIVGSENTSIERLVVIAPNLATHRGVKARNFLASTATGDRLPLPFNADSFSDKSSICEWIERDPLRWTDQPRAFMEVSRRLLGIGIERISQIKSPVHSIFATVDHLIDNAEVKRILGQRESMEVLPGGHALILEKPKEIADKIVSWSNL